MKRIRLFQITLSMGLFLLSSSCLFRARYTCVSENLGCGSFSSCCTPTQCYYEYNGKEYWCNGTDCSDAAADLADDMCYGYYKSASENREKSEILMEITRELSIQVYEE